MTGFVAIAQAQTKVSKNANPVCVDKSGVMRWTKTGKEATFFGVNYTVPFAYGFRSHKALGKDLKKAIDEDVYHFARLGLDAFRVHVWDTEISDSLGNLLENEHLKLFDYLLYKLKERNIKILITPLAFWGNGYPEPDEKTGSFSSIYGKQKVLVTEAAIKAQEVYLKQFFKHVNPYTKQTYGSDNDVIAMEINNEPHHSGTKKGAADYIERMVAAVKSSGWTKPIFYNISESPTYADVVAASDIDGVSFQWYPTGLVAGHKLQGNQLPNVDVYKIPFDTITAYKNKARMVYEFDAGDVLESYMYPAMARSFRTAGFQWATQFAYDPMATAYANTEYQTHYLNLAYTPSKAISLMIAAKAFHHLPRLQSYGTYPADSVFKNFRVSYKNSLSEMNGDTAFYYSSTTSTAPLTISKLKHIAGVGSSPVINYSGSGAYFLDKLSDGMWRLEVMPDAIFIRDPFEKASPQKEVTRIEWNTQKIEIRLPDLAQNFFVTPLNGDNSFQTQAAEKHFTIKPGTYIISNQKTAHEVLKKLKTGVLKLTEFVAPPPVSSAPFVVHKPYQEISAGKPFVIEATITGVDTADTVFVELHNTSGIWKTISLQQKWGSCYSASVPAEVAVPGLLEYRIIVQKKPGDTVTFPGNYKGDPYAWNYYHNDTWKTFVVPEGAPLELFNTTTDRQKLNLYNPDWRNIRFNYVASVDPKKLALKTTFNAAAQNKMAGWQMLFANTWQGRTSEIASCSKLVIRARSGDSTPVKLKVTLATADGAAVAAYATVHGNFKNIELPLSSFKRDSFLLLPRPYPGFLPLYFTATGNEVFKLSNAEKLQVSFEKSNKADTSKEYTLEVESVWLQKN